MFFADDSKNNATNWSPFHYLLECIKMTPAEAKMCRGCHNRTQNLYKEMIHFAENMTDATVRSLHTPLSSCEPFNHTLPIVPLSGAAPFWTPRPCSPSSATSVTN